MALANYTDLQAAVADWLNRADLTSRIPDFIALAEAQMNRKLRTRQMIAVADSTLDAGRIALPTDYAALKQVTLLTNPVSTLSYAEPEHLQRTRRTQPTGIPRFYTIVGSSLMVAPTPDTSYPVEIIYWQKVPALSGGAPTNWVLTAHPDLYLYGALLQAAPYLRDDDRVITWSAAVESIHNDIKVENEQATQSGSPLSMKFRPYGFGRR